MLKQSVLQQCLDMRMIVSLIFMLIITVETNYAELLVRSTGKPFNFVHHSFHSHYFASCWAEERICDFFCICCQLKEIKRKNVTFRRLPLGLPAIAMSLLVSVAGRDKSCLEWLHWEIYIYIAHAVLNWLLLQPYPPYDFLMCDRRLRRRTCDSSIFALSDWLVICCSSNSHICCLHRLWQLWTINRWDISLQTFF